MNDKKIILITTSFPWGKGETFLETEIEYYKDNEVWIFPCKIDRRFKKREICNKNIKVFSGKEQFLLKKIVLALKYLCSHDCIKEILCLAKEKKLSFVKLKKIMIASYYAHLISKRLHTIIKKENVKNEELVFYSYWLYVPAYTAILLKRKLKGSIAISRCHGSDLYEETQEQNYLPFREHLKELDRIFCISENGKHYIEENYKFVSKNKLLISRLGVKNNLDKIRNYEKSDIFHIVSCSSIIPVKRIGKIIDALKLIKNIKIAWTHIGTGEDLEKTKKRAKKGLTSNVSVSFVGQLTNKQIYKTYMDNDVHLFINVSESEGIPVSIMEAISFGIPIIATDVGGNKEIVKNNMNGKLLEKDFSEQQLADIILEFYNMDEKIYQKYRENSYMLWKENYNAEINYKEFVHKIQDK